MKNVKVKVVESCGGTFWFYRLYVRNKPTGLSSNFIDYKSNAIRAAKATAKRIGIPYSDEIIKQHGC